MASTEYVPASRLPQPCPAEPHAADSAGSVAGSVGRLAAGGALWVFLAVLAARFLGFGTSLVLARLLDPADFGLVSFAMVMIGAFTLLQDLGVPAAIIYGKRDINAVAGTALTINVAAALLLFGVTVLCTPLLTQVAGDIAIAPVSIALAFGLVISSFSSVQSALFVKDLAFRRKFLPDVVPYIVSGVLSISLALSGFGVWSLVAGQLTRAAVTTILMWRLSVVRPWPRFDWTVAVELLRYGKHVSVTSVIGFVGLNVDYFLIGYFLGPSNLGLYTMAFNIAIIPSTIISQIVSRVTFPAYSRLRDEPSALLDLFSDVFSVVCALCIPMTIAIYVTAPALVSLVLGDKWLGVVEPLRILTVYSAIRCVEWTFPSVYKAVGRPDAEWKVIVLKVSVLIPAILALVGYGITGVAIAQAIVAAVIIPVAALIFARVLGVSIWWLWCRLWPQLAGAACMAMIVMLGQMDSPVRPVLNLPAGIGVLTVVGLAAYAAVLLSLDPRLATLARSGRNVFLRS